MRRVRIVARSLHRELKQHRFSTDEIVSLTAELIGLVTQDMNDEEQETLDRQVIGAASGPHKRWRRRSSRGSALAASRTDTLLASAGGGASR